MKIFANNKYICYPYSLNFRSIREGKRLGSYKKECGKHKKHLAVNHRVEKKNVCTGKDDR